MQFEKSKRKCVTHRLTRTCVLQCSREQPILSPIPENLKNRKVFQVFKGADERNIGSNLLVTLGTKGLLSACRNQLRWKRGKGVNLWLFLTV